MPGFTVAKGTPGGLKVISFQQLASIGSATALTIPKKTKAMLISADGQSVRIRFDGTAPTAAIGHLLANGDSMFYHGDYLTNIQVIQTAATAVVNVTYFG